MNPTGQPRLVQFMHPGDEHKPAGEGRDWNSGRHKRIFLGSAGAFINKNGAAQSSTLLFWAEWEADAELVKRYEDAPKYRPQYLFAPYYRPRSSYLGLANTDPFVSSASISITPAASSAGHAQRSAPKDEIAQ